MTGDEALQILTILAQMGTVQDRLVRERDQWSGRYSALARKIMESASEAGVQVMEGTPFTAVLDLTIGAYQNQIEALKVQVLQMSEGLDSGVAQSGSASAS